VSNVVRHVEVPVISNRQCNELYGKISHKVQLDIASDMLCAGYEKGGRDACQVRFYLPDSYNEGLSFIAV
jgi:hypothetical protein